MTKRQFKNFRDEIVQILSCLDPLLSLDHKKKWSEISDNNLDLFYNNYIATDAIIGKYCKIPINQSWTKKEKDLSDSTYKRNIKEIISNGSYHSDEVSETDDEKAQEEIDQHIRPKNKAILDNNHVILQRKRWYDNSTYKNDSKLPDNVPEWTVSFNYNVKKKIKGVVEQRRKAIKDEFDKESGEDVEDKEDEEDEENELNRRVEEKLGRRVEAKIRRRIKEEQS
ncbi:unnamed protein product [Rhizophagus irregularis]|nr:unnamed protein product [Rhizophagus irregularis]